MRTPSPELLVSPDMAALLPELRLVPLRLDLDVRPSLPAHLRRIGDYLAGFAQNPAALAEAEAVNAESRAAYKRLGKDPSRYRPSAEALRRRLLQGKDLYAINQAVDALNMVSASTGLSVGGYDLATLAGPRIELRRGGGEAYEALGRGLLNIQDLPVLYDALGPFGSPTSDSARTGIGLGPRQVLLVFFAFGNLGQAACPKAIALMQEALDWA